MVVAVPIGGGGFSVGDWCHSTTVWGFRLEWAISYIQTFFLVRKEDFSWVHVAPLNVWSVIETTLVIFCL